MKKCSNCGRLETDSTGFCPDCGSPNFEPLIKDDSTSANQTQAPASTPESVPASAPESAFDSLKSQNTPFEATASPFEANSTPNPFATPQPAQPQGTGENYSYAGLIMILINLVLSIIIFVGTFAGTFAILDKTMEYADNFDSSYSEDYDYEDSDDMIIGENETKTEKATESSTTSTVKFASDNWTDFNKMQFAYNNKVYTLGETTLQEMIDDGVPFESDSVAHFDDAVDKDYESTRFYITLKNGGDEYTELCVKVGNFTTSTKKARELPLTTVEYDAGFEGHGNIAKELRFVVPYDVTFQQVKDKCGEPDYVYQGDSYSKLEYTEEAEQYYNDKQYTFEFNENVLTSIELEYLP